MGLVASIYYVEGLAQMCGVPVVSFGDHGWYLTRSSALPPLGLGITTLLTLSTGVAQAAPPTLIPDGQFESEVAIGGVAIDQSTTEADASRGDVYVAGFVTEQVNSSPRFVPGALEKFDASGHLLSPPSPFGVSPPSPFEPQIGFSGYSDAAVNPVNGDVYAMDGLTLEGVTSDEILKYDPSTGAQVGSPFSVPASGNFEFVIPGWTVVQIATDSAGNVYVPVVSENEVLEYDPSTCPASPTLCPPLKTFTGGSGAGALKGPTGVSVDPSGGLWVADTGNQRVEELSPADAPLAEIKVEGLQSVAVDAHGHIFAIVNNDADSCELLKSPCSHLVEYSSTGARLVDLGAGQFGAMTAQTSAGTTGALPNMVAVNDSSGRVYVTEGVTELHKGINSRVFIYAPPVPPKLESELAVGVTTSEAKLGALVNPGGIGGSYRFEYLTAAGYAADGETFSGPDAATSVPFPEGDTGAGFTSRTVWAGALGLAPGTTYHYRVVVTGALGEPLVGRDQTFTTETAAQAACPNELLRTGFSAALPDCRAYEIVTPPNKFSAQATKDVCGNSAGECHVEGALEGTHAAPEGNSLAFPSEDIFPGSQSGGRSYLATRNPAGWSVENELPPQNYYTRGKACTELPTENSEDLSKTIFSATSGGICGLEPELISGEPRGGTQNLYLRDNTLGTYQLINVTPPNTPPADAQLVAESTDFSRVVFTEEAQLTPEAPAGANNLYEWSAGYVRLVTLLTNEAPVAGSFAAISADGSRVFFTVGGDLYARVNGEHTVQLDASQAGGPGGGGKFLAASTDGSRVLFTDDASAGLTADTVPGSGTNLYLYDSAAPAAERLADLTPVSNAGAPALGGLSKDGSMVFFTDDSAAALTADTVPGSGINLYRYDSSAPVGQRLTDLTPAVEAEVLRVVSVSEDGSDVYLQATGVLTPEANEHGEKAQSGQENENLYLSHDGKIRFIVTSYHNEDEIINSIIKASKSGAFLAFESSRSLTGYDNTPTNGVCSIELTGPVAVCPEIFLYSSATNSLVCASCNPSGEPPPGVSASHELGGARFEKAAQRQGARNLTENGRLFFDSEEGLLPSDTNGIGGCSAPTGIPTCADVYEFEPGPGVGTCAEPSGCLFLISTGTSTAGTFFVDASANGDDVFIRELQRLLPSDTEENGVTVYDARVDGGVPEQPPPPPCATAEACRTAPAPAPSIFGPPATQTFSGVGNLSPQLVTAKKVTKKTVKCKKGFVKSKKGKCVKRKPKKEKAGNKRRPKS